MLRNSKVALMITLTLIAATSFSAAAAPAWAAGATYYVATNGNNGNNGTSIATPFRTIQKAADVAQPGDQVLIRGGVYRETVTAPRSGASGSLIRFDNYGNEQVTISALDVVTGSWTVDSGSTYRASASLPLGDENQVFVNGTMIRLAQWPNDTNLTDHFNLFYAEINQGTDSGSTSSITDAGIGNKATNFFQNGVVWWLAEHKWVAIGTTITSSSANTINFSTPTGWEKDYNNPGAFYNDGKNQYFVSGLKVLLDTANEWYHESGTLYLQVAGGGSPSGSTVEYKSREVAFNFNNQDYVDVGGIDVIGGSIVMSGDFGAWTDSTISHSYHHNGRGAGEFLPGGEGSYGNVISGNENYFGYNTIQVSSAQGVNVTGDDNWIDNNYVFDTGYMSSYDEAIRLAPTAERADVTRNTIERTGQVCIGGGWNDNADHLISYNRCAEAQMLGDDRGGIQAKGAEVSYNVVTAVGRGLARSLTPAFYTDTSGDNVRYHHNVVYGTSADAAFRVNNTGNPANGNDNIVVYNNTVSSGPSSLVLYDSGGTAIVANNLHNPSAGNFVNAGASDFRLASGSAAINAGSVIAPFTDGYAGSAPDLGAYESGASASRSSWTAGVGSTQHFGRTVMANLAQNPSFESGASNYGQTIQNWTTNGYGSHANADYTETFGGAHAGTYHATHYKAGAYQVYTSQTLTNLTNGTYTLTAFVKSSGGQTYALMDANGFGGSTLQVQIGASSTWTSVSIPNINITNGQVTFGFYSESSGGHWLYFDSVSLIKN